MLKRRIRKLSLTGVTVASAIVLTALGATAYAVAGTSSAASTPKQFPRPAVVKADPVKFIVRNKEGKIIRRGTMAGRVVRLGSQAAKQAGAAVPETAIASGSVCMYYGYVSYEAQSGQIFTAIFNFASSPFVIGSMFNESVQNYFAAESEYQSGNYVYVSARQDTQTPGANYPGPLTGYYGVLYFCGS